MLKNTPPILYFLCPQEALFKILYGTDGELASDEIVLGLSRIYPCAGQNGELRSRVDTLKNALEKYFIEKDENNETELNRIDKQNLHNLFNLVYNYPYYFYADDTFQLYALSLTNESGLKHVNNWKSYASETGVAIALDFSKCKSYVPPREQDEARKRVHSQDKKDISFYVQSNEKNIGILTPISYTKENVELVLKECLDVLNDPVKGNDPYRLALSCALTDLNRKEKMHEYDYESRLFCIHNKAKSVTLEKMLRNRGIIPLKTDISCIEGKNKMGEIKKLLPFKVPYVCIEKIIYFKEKTRTDIVDNAEKLIKSNGKVEKIGKPLSKLLEQFKSNE